MSWYKVTLPSEESGLAGKAETLQNAFADLWSANKGPKDAAMFSQNSENLKDIFCYFSPGAMRIARTLIESYGAVPCPAPRQGTGVNLSAGDAGALEMLLPRAGQNS